MRYDLAQTISAKHPLRESYGPFLAQLLLNRGIRSVEEAEHFLNPRWELGNPFRMEDMERAVERIRTAIERGEHILIYADYDADGIPAAIILLDFFRALGHEHVDVVIPHRHREGYGFHVHRVEEAAERGVSLIVTVDVGIRAHGAAKRARGLGIDLIVTDHHLPEEKDGEEVLPDAYAILNPKRKGDRYPEKMLSGAGVAFTLVRAFLERYREEHAIPDGWEKWLLDMVGIATLSDMVPLTGENRTLAHYGLRVLREVLKRAPARRPGLAMLAQRKGIIPDFLREEDVVFQVSPHINAASRLGDPSTALRLFRAKSFPEADELARELTELNELRKSLTREIVAEAELLLGDDQERSVILVGSEEWPIGVLGLVATKLVERYRVPVFVWGAEAGEAKGSCRAPTGVHLVSLMEKVRDGIFSAFGGHAEAGGFRLPVGKIRELERELRELTREVVAEEESVSIDMEFHLRDLRSQHFLEQEKLGPFGVGNPVPVLRFPSVRIENISRFGKAREHLRLRLSDGGVSYEAIAFFQDPSEWQLREGEVRDIIVSLERSFYRGREEQRLRIITIS